MPGQAERDAATLERELSRLGLLLQHDARLPSATSLLAEQPIAGSWWGHPQGNRIYAALVEFERGAGKLAAKLVNRKITYIGRGLWPAFLCLALKRAQAPTDELSALARRLFELTLDNDSVRLDQPPADALDTLRERSRATRELEEQLLVHCDSEHTNLGAHVKRLRSWRAWAKEIGVQPLLDASRAEAELREAVNRLVPEDGRAVNVAFLDSEPRRDLKVARRRTCR
jgi:hypothetical protein